MMLRELAAVATAALPIRDFADHLRLGTGFADDGSQDAVLETYLRSALAAIEARTGKALLRRSFVWTLTAWGAADAQRLPIAPVTGIESLNLHASDDTVEAVDLRRLRLVPDTHRPAIEPTGAHLPTIPTGGIAELTLEAGFGADWASIPADLRQAVLMLAAGYYERRGVDGGVGSFPFGVNSLIERHRDLRIGRGAT